jgi:hypothetical protein
MRLRAPFYPQLKNAVVRCTNGSICQGGCARHSSSHHATGQCPTLHPRRRCRKKCLPRSAPPGHAAIGGGFDRLLPDVQPRSSRCHPKKQVRTRAQLEKYSRPVCFLLERCQSLQRSRMAGTVLFLSPGRETFMAGFALCRTQPGSRFTRGAGYGLAMVLRSHPLRRRGSNPLAGMSGASDGAPRPGTPTWRPPRTSLILRTCATVLRAAVRSVRQN